MSTETQLRIVEERGAALEAEHAVSAVLCDATGRIIHSVGPEIEATWRSASKPFQLEASLSFLPDAFVDALSERDLALGAASHSGEPQHVAGVRSLLDRMACSAEGLRCGAHWPVHEPSGRTLASHGERATALHNNCSGKHAYMLGATRSSGLAPDYRPVAHPLQQRVVERVRHHTGGRVSSETVIDGCGVPCFVLPLSAMAQAWASIATCMARHDGVLSRIGWAMCHEPWFMSGTDRLDLMLVHGATEPIVAKVGAMGIQCVAFPERGLGLALKLRTGSSDARPLVVEAVMDRWLPGLLRPDTLRRFRDVVNVVGDVVGQRRGLWS